MIRYRPNDIFGLCTESSFHPCPSRKSSEFRIFVPKANIPRMSEQSSLLEKLEGLLIRFEEIGTLITDPAVISDMKRYVKLTKEYRELEKISEAAKRYKQLLN